MSQNSLYRRCAVQHETAEQLVSRRNCQAKRIKLASLPIAPGTGITMQIRHGAERFKLTDAEGRKVWYGNATEPLCDLMDEAWPEVHDYLLNLKASVLAQFFLAVSSGLEGVLAERLSSGAVDAGRLGAGLAARDGGLRGGHGANPAGTDALGHDRLLALLGLPDLAALAEI